MRGRILFRSYAGMTRIRFKGPAHRHLSIVRCSPRNGRNLSFSRPEVNGASVAGRSPVLYSGVSATKLIRDFWIRHPT